MIIGLTGSIGMGKSTTGKIFENLGFLRWDSDQAVHELLKFGHRGYRDVQLHFPEVAVDEQIDRKTLGKIVFGDPAKLKLLESLLHPLVRDQKNKFIEMANRMGKSVVLEIPLLFETHFEDECDAVFVVIAPPYIQRHRVMARAGMTEEKFQQIMTRQYSDQKKCQLADYVIQTGLNIRDTRRRIICALREFDERNNTGHRDDGF
jgi:dephospho-CoA kinase